MKRRKNKPPTKSAVDYIEMLYNKYASKFKFVAKQYIRDDTLAEDILQNVFEKALLYSEKILDLPENKAFTFLYVIVRNTAYDMIKVESRNSHEELTYDDGEESEHLIDPNDHYLEFIDLKVMKDIIKKLPTNQQTVLILHYYYGFSFLEIATLLQISELAAKKRCSLARSSLRALYEKEGLSYEYKR
ncbi:RNA polymerase sigma factor [Anaerostipes sp.]|uniref:RNA polymerase sigma factor n=1 Tax=Anaerostipes sp. TaxID=1872530 RepID=UPI0025B87D93|nr:RNA polymerase sigma factor [Anaerostipes sp.]